MRLRFRIGPFTFGKGGTRLSVWKRGTGVSIPLSKKKGRSFGKVKAGPFSAYFTGKPKQKRLTSLEKQAIDALPSNTALMNKLQKDGVTWYGIQLCLRDALPQNLEYRDDMAFKLVPKAMNTVFGNQNTAWKTVKRPSKSRKGETTWIVLL